jgi:hypothetical protein
MEPSSTTGKRDNDMKRIIKTGAAAAIAALAALGVIGTATTADATVAVTDGVGFVGKGDVQDALGLANDAALQVLFKSAGGIKFTAGTVTLGNETRWVCGAGTQSQTSLVTQAAPVNATPNTNAQGKLSNGWNLNGRITDGSVAGKYISGKRVGAPYVGYCPAGEAFGGFVDYLNPATAYDRFTVTSETGPLQVNGVDLPNTPIV